jgi:hypothetical protein
MTWKFLLLVSDPAVVVTVTGPEVAPAGTVAVAYVSEVAVKTVAATPLKLTAVTLLNPCPNISAVPPTDPVG